MAIARILVVDDDEIVRVTLSDILRLNDFEVTTASTVSEALSQITAISSTRCSATCNMPGAGGRPHRGQRHAPCQPPGHHHAAQLVSRHGSGRQRDRASKPMRFW